MPTHFTLLFYYLIGSSVISMLIAGFVTWITANYDGMSFLWSFLIVFGALFLFTFMAFYCKISSARSRLREIGEIVKSGQLG